MIMRLRARSSRYCGGIEGWGWKKPFVELDGSMFSVYYIGSDFV